jgi:hypothetical protein
MQPDLFNPAQSSLQSINESLAIEFDTGFESQKPYAALDEKDKKLFVTKVSDRQKEGMFLEFTLHSKLAKAVNDGLGGARKDSFLTYLQGSAR